MYIIPTLTASTTATDIFDTGLDPSSPFWMQPKAPVYLSSNIDVLALSQAWYRLRLSGGNTVNSFEDPYLLKEVIDDDIITASKIRDFYQKQAIVWSLKGLKLSKFRTDMCEFITHDVRIYNENHIGMIFKLPEFYKYDTELSELKLEHFSNSDLTLGKAYTKTVKSLKPLSRLHRKIRLKDTYEYWFTVSGCDQGALLSIEKNNTLLSLWEDMFHNRQELTINAFYHVVNGRGFKHYDIVNFSLLDTNKIFGVING